MEEDGLAEHAKSGSILFSSRVEDFGLIINQTGVNRYAPDDSRALSSCRKVASKPLMLTPFWSVPAPPPSRSEGFGAKFWKVFLPPPLNNLELSFHLI